MTDTVYMIHGMWGSAWYWEHYRRALGAGGYQCIAPTLRFHDMDPRAVPDPRLGTTSLLDYAADLEREIREIGVKPILLGHSMGGLLAQILASRGLARALVLLAPAAPAGIIGIRPSVLRSFRSVYLRWGFWKKPMRQTFNEAAYSMLHLLPPDEQRRVYDRFVYESGRAAYEIGCWPLDSTRAARVDASKVSCPVLVLAGTEDRITPASIVRKVARKYKNVATYKEFPDHAHWMVGEPGWEAVAGYAVDWLKRAGARRASA